jgi:LAGLIDADG endonuclease
MSKEEASYLAGLIDGEGTVTLTKREKNAQRTLTITIANTELDLLEYPVSIIGAGVITRKRVRNQKHKLSYAYRVTGRQALSILSQILPYLRSYKKERAKFALEKYIDVTPRNGRYSAELLEKKKEFDRKFLAILAK